jgi:hypothetical protein
MEEVALARIGSTPARAMSRALALTATLWLGLSTLATAADPPVKSPDQLLVLATGSNRGEVEQCGCKTNPKGGLARRAALIDAPQRCRAGSALRPLHHFGHEPHGL